jgi:hypothetical protein
MTIVHAATEEAIGSPSLPAHFVPFYLPHGWRLCPSRKGCVWDGVAAK